MVFRRRTRRASKDSSQPSSQSEPNSEPPQPTEPQNTLTIADKRVYKRWIILSSIISLVFAYFFFPRWFPTVYDRADLSQLSESFLKSQFFQSMTPSKSREEFMADIWRFLRPSFLSGEKGKVEEELSAGRSMYKAGLRAKHPVILVPGIISTGLEVWQGRKCAEPYFRQRIWGTLSMLRMMLTDKDCWLEHLRMDIKTGLDPEGIRVRAAQGLEAADFMFPGIWILGRIIENLAEVGYDSNNMFMASYDWRVDVSQLEKRDAYFTRLKLMVETAVNTTGQKAVIVANSYGALVAHYFLKWVEAEPSKVPEKTGGGGGKLWVSSYVHAVVNLSGPLLGVAKTASSIVSGEARDTAIMGRFESFLVDKLLNKKERASVFRTWSGPFAMLPKGGSRVWGSTESSPDGIPVPLLSFRTSESQKKTSCTFTYDQIYQALEMFMPSPISKRIMELFSIGIAQPKDIAQNDFNPRTWTNPLESRLPDAPQLTFYSLYGTGCDTEKGYEYRSLGTCKPDTPSATGANAATEYDYTRSINPKKMHLPHLLNTTASDPKLRLYNGVYHVDGDSTVTILSLGYMGAYAWRQYKHLNPSSVQQVIREYPNNSTSVLSTMRGDPGATDHVSILGNMMVIQDIIKIACGYELEDQIHSNIIEQSKRVKLIDD